jgi:hypothetical protein
MNTKKECHDKRKNNKSGSIMTTNHLKTGVELSPDMLCTPDISETMVYACVIILICKNGADNSSGFDVALRCVSMKIYSI